MQFQDDLAAGVILVRPALQSPDYSPGSAGWAVLIDGSAEFNNVVIRGAQQIGGTALYYNGVPALGDLLLSISAAGGTDAYGNTYVGGLGIYDPDGSQIQLQSGAGATEYLTPQTVAGTTWSPAYLTTTLGASQRGGIQLIAPATTVNTSRSAVTLYGGGPTTNDATILSTADRWTHTGDLQVVSGKFTADNRFVGSVTIAPSAPNTPTSVTVNYGRTLTGSAFRGVASAVTIVPGTEVTEVSLSSITSTTCVVWATRTNTTNTVVNFIIEGV